MRPPQSLAAYDFSYTQDMIANTPATPRESARVLVYKNSTHAVSEDTFAHLGKYLPSGTVLVLNNTKVVPARLPLRRSTGGIVPLLWLEHCGPSTFKALSPKGLRNGEVLSLGTTRITVCSKSGSVYTCTHRGSKSAFMRAFYQKGSTPTPPYIKNITLSERSLRSRYQTIFAKHAGSVAAPTASLHFSKRLLAALKRNGVSIHYVTLHVGLGTFEPLTDTHLREGLLHEEHFSMPRTTYRALVQAKKEGRLIIPVGTTALRTIESVWNDSRHSLTGTTRLFIREGYVFKIASGLITNFHVPKSSLLMLVGALVGRARILSLYDRAKKHGFRFFSFGDGMLILP